MPFLAVSLSCVQARPGVVQENVLPGGKRDDVIGIAAVGNFAEMVKMEPVGDRPILDGVGEAVNALIPTADLHTAISAVDGMPFP